MTDTTENAIEQDLQVEGGAKVGDAYDAVMFDDTPTNDLEAQITELEAWWHAISKGDVMKTVPKAVEYGAMDLDVMGQVMVSLNPTAWAGADAAERLRVGREMALLFYMQGKIGRALGAYQVGRLPSDDTLFDITVYSMMLRRVREVGTWLQ